MSDSTPPLTRDERMWCGARDGCTFEMIGEWQYSVQREAIPPVVARIFSGDSTSPLTREASLVRGEAVDVLLRRLWEWKGSVQREERAPPLRKARGIVRKISLMVGMGSNPSGSRPNFLGATEPHL